MITASDFFQLIYGALSQRGANIFITPTNTLRALDLAVKDVLNYEGVQWAFQLRTSVEFVTTGTSDTFTFTIPDSDKEYMRRIVSLTCNKSLASKIVCKSNMRLTQVNDVFFRYGDSTITVRDNIGTPMVYSIDYFVGFKSMVSIEDIIPLPEFFFPALFDFTMSYLMLPFGQYGEGKDQNFYERATGKMVGILKSNSSQQSSLVININ